MRALGVAVVIIFMAAVILPINLSQFAYAVDMTGSNPAVPQTASQTVSQPAAQHESQAVRKVELEIDADRDRIIKESNAINLDRRKLKDADKAKSEQVKEEIRKDIEDRESKIKDLKKEIRDKKEQRYFLMNGKQKDEARRSRLDAK